MRRGVHDARRGAREPGATGTASVTVDTPLGMLTVHVPKLREGYYSPEGIIGAWMPPSPRRWWRCGCRACPPGAGRAGRPRAGRGPSGPFRGVASGWAAGRAGRRVPVASPVGPPVLLSVAGRDVRALPGRRGRVEHGGGRRDRVRRRRQEARGRVRHVRHPHTTGIGVGYQPTGAATTMSRQRTKGDPFIHQSKGHH